MIYLDNASTTKPNDQVIEEVIFTLRNCWSNPSNTYETTDFSPRDILDEAKNIIASSINCTKDEIYFTSGASEGNSWGMAQGDVCYYSPYEHHNYWASDEKSGLWDSIEERVCISDDDFLNYDCWGYTNDKWVYSHMLVSNITGEIFDVAPLFKHAKSNKGAKFFTLCDCTQAFGNMPIDVKELGCDMAVFSGHKFGAPKGIGFVYLSNEAPRPIIPLITGSQQFELRGGTENIPYIAGLGLAAELASQKIEHKTKICKTLNKVLKDSLDESGIPYFIPETKNKIESTTLFLLNLKLYSPCSQIRKYMWELAAAVMTDR